MTASEPLLRPCSLPWFDWQLDPYGGCEHDCSYCYALDDAPPDQAPGIRPEPDLAERLDRELAKLRPQTIYIGYTTDPYQPIEATRCATRQALEVLARRGFSASILTKSQLVGRDIDLLEAIDASVAVSVAFQDERVRALFEPATPSLAGRLEGLERLRRAGIRTSGLVCPVMPFLTDVSALITALHPLVESIWIYRLQVDSATGRSWSRISRILREHYPGLLDRYLEIAFSRHHPYWAELEREIRGIEVSGAVDIVVALGSPTIEPGGQGFHER